MNYTEYRRLMRLLAEMDREDALRNECSKASAWRDCWFNFVRHGNLDTCFAPEVPYRPSEGCADPSADCLTVRTRYLGQWVLP